MQNQNLFTKVFFFILLSLLIKNTHAQTGLNFQGVARNANNVILASQPISLRLSILQGSATGNAEYTEVRKVNTNAQGLFTAVIGDTGAISTLGNFASINWKSNPKFLKIEMDAAAGNNFIIMGTTQFQSVAYAQFANSVDAENIAGIVPVARGGTGTNSLAALKTALSIDKATVGLSNADNTTDLLKPISTATQAALSLKLNAADTSKYSKQKYLDSALLTKLNTNTIIDAGTLTGTTLKSSVTNSSLTTVGTIETGIWSATTIDIEHGGTNSTAIPTAGGIGFGTGSAHAYTSAGTAGQILSSNGTFDPIWVTPNTISVPYTGATSAVDLGAFDLKVNSLSIGLGAGNVPTNTTFGLNALNSNTTGGFNVAVGTLALSSNTSGNGNVAVGSTALIKNTTGGFNTATGVSALKNNEIGNSNTAFGNSALVSNVSGNNNVANGLFALRNNVTGSSNVAIGSNTLVTNISGSRNTAIGQDADLASDGLTNATAIGSGAIVNADNTIQLGNSSISSVVTSGTMSATAYTGTWSGEIIDIAHGGTGTNTLNLVDLSTDQNISGAKTFLSDANINGLTIGKGAGNIPTNTVTGSDALRSNTNGVQNIAFGYTALKSNSIGNDNVAVGAFSLSTNTSGLSNIAIGTSTMFGNQTGNSNIAVGGGALIHNDNGNNNVANGVLALQDNVTGSSNVALGNYALASNSSGNGNTVIGYNSFYHNTTGSNNTAIGANANVGAANLTNATAIGAGAIVSAHNTIQLGNTNVSSVITSGTISASAYTGIWNGGIIDIAHGGTGTSTVNFVDLSTDQNISGAKTFLSDANINGLTIGKGAGDYAENTVLGRSALSSNTLGKFNTAIGRYALSSNLIGEYNTVIGNYGLSANTSGNYNSGIGTHTLFSNLTGENNTTNGAKTLYSNTSGNDNTATGFYALHSNTTGENNTASGANALNSNTTGYDNTAIGHSSLASLTTGDDNTAIGSGADVLVGTLTNATAIGAFAIAKANNTIQLGNDFVENVVTSGTISATGFVSATGYGTASGTSSQFLKADGSIDGTTYVNKSSSSIGIGVNAGLGQGNEAISIGTFAGTSNQGIGAIAIGSGAGKIDQTSTAIAVGLNAGGNTQSVYSIAMGLYAGENQQGANSIAVGLKSGRLNQGPNAVAIGDQAGYDTQGANSVALGNLAGNTNQAANSIILNATGTALNASTTGFFVAPIRSGTSTSTVYYDPATNEITYAPVSTVDAGTLTGTSLSSNVVNSSLTSVGTLASITTTGKAIVGASTAASASAVLEASSTTQGFLPPRMTIAQRDAIASPAAGLVIWCSNCGLGELGVFNGSSWTKIDGSISTSEITIGSPFQGGVVAYILQDGDPGYIPNTTHGLIAATSDQSTGIRWHNGVAYIRTYAGGVAIGTGLANTNAIILYQGETKTSYAAGLARAYTGGGYADWYLPSRDELGKLYLNKDAIGGFSNNYYWSSTEHVDGANHAWIYHFGFGGPYSDTKEKTYNVRAIRAF